MAYNPRIKNVDNTVQISASNLTAPEAVIDVSSSNAALRITQRGSGEAFRVEDDTNPDSSAFVIGNAGSVQIGQSAPVGGGDTWKLSIVDENNAPLIISEYSNVDGVTLRGYRARGTYAVSSSVLNGDTLVSVRGFGLTSNGTWSFPAAYISLNASQNFTNTANGGSIRFFTAENNTIFASEKVIITDSGFTGIGTTTPNHRLDVSGNICISGSGNGLIFSDGTEIISAESFGVRLLVIGGGGGGGGVTAASTNNAGGGGAGGYMEGGTTTFGEIFLTTGKAYRVTVGAGGAAGTSGGTAGGAGGDSYFGLNIALGGGGGGGSGVTSGLAGGSGGGSATGAGVGTATSRIYQTGSNGGQGNGGIATDPGGGGGGAGSVGANGVTSVGGAGGAGLFSTITGVSVERAGGGGGGVDSGTAGTATGGGGAGGLGNSAGANGTANTGGGGGGASTAGSAFAGGTGGSGIIIIRYPANYTATFTVGVTETTTTTGNFKVTTITAAGAADTVTFS